jgi:Leucine-rich repeat (LRR) protein
MSNFEKEDPQGSGDSKEYKINDGACSPFSKKADSSKVMRNLLQGSRFLHVIYLDGLEIGNKLPSEIGSFVHLHYLGITSCSLGEVPASVGKLTRLQTLDVRGTMVTKLPSEFWKIQTLRHVFGSIILPRRVGNLEQLQTLQGVKPSDDGGSWDATTFARMKRLQSLYIWGLTNENVHALVPVYALKYLLLLSISGKVVSSDLFTRSKLTRLQVMVLKGEIVSPLEGSSPRFYFPNLTKLSLKETKVSQDFIDKLSQELPLLASLALFPKSYRGKCLSLTKGFHSLKELKLDVDLKDIFILGHACPYLKKLEISIYCRILISKSGPTLRKLSNFKIKFSMII